MAGEASHRPGWTDRWIAIGTICQSIILLGALLFAILEFSTHLTEVRFAAVRESVQLHRDLPATYLVAIARFENQLLKGRTISDDWNSTDQRFVPDARVVGDTLHEAALCDVSGACAHEAMLTLWCYETHAFLKGSAGYPVQPNPNQDSMNSVHRDEMMKTVPGLPVIEKFYAGCS